MSFHVCIAAFQHFAFNKLCSDHKRTDPTSDVENNPKEKKKQKQILTQRQTSLWHRQCRLSPSLHDVSETTCGDKIISHTHTHLSSVCSLVSPLTTTAQIKVQQCRLSPAAWLKLCYFHILISNIDFNEELLLHVFASCTAHIIL